MINSPTSKPDQQYRRVHSSLKKSNGAATLLLSVVLLTLSAMLVIFAAQYGSLQDKSVSNLTRTKQAYEAAQAGMNFGINYFRSNAATIIANSSGGYLQPYSNTDTTNVSLGNASFTVTFTNPTANDYTLINVISVGSSDDGTATKTIYQQIQFGSIIQNPPTVALLARGEIDLGGNSEIINTINNNTIISGSSVSLSGSANTTTSSGESSNSSTTGPDITENDPTYSGLNDTQFFETIFNGDPASVQSAADYVYTNSGNTNYKDVIGGVNGATIWINQTSGEARLSSNMQVGTAASPVLLVIDGNVKFSGNVTIYGFVLILGSSVTDLTGNVSIIGGVSTTGALDARGNIEVTYDPTVLTNLQNNPGMGYYAKVPGSWRDFQ